MEIADLLHNWSAFGICLMCILLLAIFTKSLLIPQTSIGMHHTTAAYGYVYGLHMGTYTDRRGMYTDRRGTYTDRRGTYVYTIHTFFKHILQ